MIEVGGKRYTLSRMDRTIADRFLDFVRKRQPDPFEQVRQNLKGFPEAIQHRMIDRAMDKASKIIGYSSPEYEETLETPEGSYHMLWLLFQKHHPDVSEKEVIDIVTQTVEEHGLGYVGQKMKETQGVLPVNENDVKEKTLVEFGLLEAAPEKKG